MSIFPSIRYFIFSRISVDNLKLANSLARILVRSKGEKFFRRRKKRAERSNRYQKLCGCVSRCNHLMELKARALQGQRGQPLPSTTETEFPIFFKKLPFLCEGDVKFYTPFSKGSHDSVDFLPPFSRAFLTQCFNSCDNSLLLHPPPSHRNFA